MFYKQQFIQQVINMQIEYSSECLVYDNKLLSITTVVWREIRQMNSIEI